MKKYFVLLAVSLSLWTVQAQRPSRSLPLLQQKSLQAPVPTANAAVAKLPAVRVASAVPQYDFEAGGLFYKKLGEGRVEVTFHDSASCVYYFNSDSDYNTPEVKHSYYSGDIIVPATVTTSEGTFRVERIGDWAFAYANGVTSITLPEGITSLGRGAMYATSFERLELPSTLRSIGARAFTGGVIDNVSTPSLEAWLQIDFTDTNSNPIWAGGGQLLIDGEVLRELDIPEGVTEVKDFAFGICPTITEVHFPSTLRRIGQMAFYYNTSLAIVDMPAGLEEIAYGAFNICPQLTEVVLPGTLRTIASYAFSGCRISAFTIPASVEEIGAFALSQADEALQSIRVEAGNTHFASLDGILYSKDITRLLCYPAGKKETRYTMPETVREVDGAALGTNGYITDIDISPALQRIGPNGLLTAKDVNLHVGDLAAFCRIVLKDDADGDDFYAPWSPYTLYVDGQLVTELALPEGITELGLMQFMFCKSLESVTLPATLRRVRQFAFGQCENLRSVTLPAALEQLEFYAFGYSSLREVHVQMTNPFSFVPVAGDQEHPSLDNVQPFSSYTATLYVPVGTVELYQQTEGWKAFAAILEDTEENQPREDVFVEVGRGTFTSQLLNRSYIGILEHSRTNDSHYRIRPFIYNEDGICLTVAADGSIYAERQSTGWDYASYGLIYACDPLEYGFPDEELGKATLYGGADFYGNFDLRLIYFVDGAYFEGGYGRIAYIDTFTLEELNSGIQNLEGSAASSVPLYDLQGRRLLGVPVKGIYVQGGRKLMR
ncbi:MAG: leucine-rich repeat domain-containing protein [Alloprevotella sp.]|nr:leucine-rich repeat domain-containing protein [Alloprevotella sp.]